MTDVKKDGRGRPLKNDRDKLKTRFSVALTEQDYEKYLERYQASGQKQSAYTRNLVMKGLNQDEKKPA